MSTYYTGTIALEERPPKLPIYCFRCADDPNHSTLRSAAKAGDRHLTGYLVATAAAARPAGGRDMWWREKHHYLSEIHSKLVMVLNPQKFNEIIEMVKV